MDTAPSYADLPTIDQYVIPTKQAAKRHYGSHQYFTKRAFNVVQTYIERFSKPGDVVCDPYGGTGVTAIEALVKGRKAIYVDVSSWAGFLAQQIAKAPVDLEALGVAFSQVESGCAGYIKELWALPEAEVDAQQLQRWYPDGVRLPRNADVDFVHELFTRRQLLALSELYHHIRLIPDPVSRDLLRYAFSATLYMCNRTFISAKNRAPSRGGSSIFSIYRYKVAKTPIELDPWDQFKKRMTSLIAAKRETNREIGAHAGGSSNGRFIKGYAQRLTQYVDRESVDYIFTDPPYGAHIAYLDLTRMWDAWLGFDTTAEDYAEEAIEGGDAKHSTEHFTTKLADGISQMFEVLKYDRWMSLVFAHREPAMWDSVVKAAEAAGFEYVNTVAQPLSVIWSMHKKKNPLTVVSGELILNFRKVRSPRTLAITRVGSDAFNLIKDSAELSIVVHGGATTDQIYAELIPKLLENGLLGDVASKMNDLTPMLNDEFEYDKEQKTWHIRSGAKLGCHIPMDDRIRFYVIDYLNQGVRTGKKSTIDDIVFHVLPKLKNGQQPREQRIIEEIRKVASPVQGKYWVLRTEQQAVFEFALDSTPSRLLNVPVKAEDEYEHNEILALLADMALAAGYTCHVGKRERSVDPDLKAVSVPQIPFLNQAESHVREAVEQIDLLWLDSGHPVLALEVEHSTAITTALDRFIEILKVERELAERLVVVAPKSRQRKLNKVLTTSHYIGAPMYMDTKIRYLWYADVIKLAKRFGSEQATKANLLSAVMQELRQPKPV